MTVYCLMLYSTIEACGYHPELLAIYRDEEVADKECKRLTEEQGSRYAQFIVEPWILTEAI